MRENLHEIRLEPSLPAVEAGWRVEEVRGHQYQVRQRTVGVSQDSTVEPEVSFPPTVVPVPSVNSPDTSERNDEEPAVTDSNVTESDPVVVTPANTTEKTYPKRIRAPVIRFEPTWWQWELWLSIPVLVFCAAVLLYCFYFASLRFKGGGNVVSCNYFRFVVNYPARACAKRG